MKAFGVLVALGVGLVIVATLLGGKPAAIGGGIAVIAQLWAVALLRPKMRAPNPEFMARWLGGMGIRLLGVGIVLIVSRTVPALLGYVGVLCRSCSWKRGFSGNAETRHRRHDLPPHRRQQVHRAVVVWREAFAGTVVYPRHHHRRLADQARRVHDPRRVPRLPHHLVWRPAGRPAASRRESAPRLRGRGRGDGAVRPQRR